MRFLLALWLAAPLLSGCDDQDLVAESPETAAAAAPAPAINPPAHSARGVVIAVANERATIRHQAVGELGWPAATRTFRMRDAQQGSLLHVGQEVAFSFVIEGGEGRLTSVLPMQAGAATPG